jgi:hypothetical protein
MVEIAEVDDEGTPLRYDESYYIRDGPSLFDRVRPLWTCWRHCHMSMLLWLSIIFITTLSILGILVLRSNTSAGGKEYPGCNRLFNWVLAFVVFNIVNMVWYSIEEGFRVSNVRADAAAPGGWSPTPLGEQNSKAFDYMRVARLVIHFSITMTFFILGCEFYTRNGGSRTPVSGCPGHTDLWLYFAVLWWLILLTYAVIAVVILCAATFACYAIVQMTKNNGAAAAEKAREDGGGEGEP